MEPFNDTELEALLIGQCKKYPHMQVEDVLKLLYQNEFGCGHASPDEESSLRWIREETEGLPPDDSGTDAVEYIGNGLCRIYLSILRRGSLAPETVNRFFLLTAGQTRGSADGFAEKAAVLIKLCEEEAIPFDAAAAEQALERHRTAGSPLWRHSQAYCAHYASAYRVVDKTFCDFLPLFCGIDEMARRKARVTVAIDGNSAAGKSFLAALLQSVYDCRVLSMDDFFLQSHQRTPRRLAEPGGNVDYERFGEEVLGPLRRGETVVCRAYDCGEQRLDEGRVLPPNRLTVVEGVYSLHPRLIDAYDIKVFLSLDAAEQRRRLAERDMQLYDKFIHEWIPMETRYFEAFQIRSKCDFVFDATRFMGVLW